MPHNHVTLRIAGRKGGLVPNPKSQRNAARLAAIENQPWQHSTGPMSGVGKAVSSLNALKRGPLTMHIVIRSWEVEDYWAECARAESALAALHGIGELWPFVNQFGCLSLNLDLGRQQRSNTAGNRWSLFSARLRRPKLDLQWCSKCGMPFDEYKALEAAADQRYCQAIALVREIIAAGNSGQLPEVDCVATADRPSLHIGCQIRYARCPEADKCPSDSRAWA